MLSAEAGTRVEDECEGGFGWRVETEETTRLAPGEEEDEDDGVDFVRPGSIRLEGRA